MLEVFRSVFAIKKPSENHPTMVEASRHQQNAFPKLKNYIRLLYRKTIFLDGAFLTCYKGHLQHVKKLKEGGAG